MSSSDYPRQRISEAFAEQISVGLGFRVERNRGTPPDLDACDEYVIQFDGPEEPQKIHDQFGAAVHEMLIGYSCFVKGEDVSDAMNALRAKLLAAAVSDRTLGGLLFGEIEHQDQGPHEYFAGMLVGGLVEWDAFSTVNTSEGASPGGYFSQEFTLIYATPINDPLVLLLAEAA